MRKRLFICLTLAFLFGLWIYVSFILLLVFRSGPAPDYGTLDPWFLSKGPPFIRGKKLINIYGADSVRFNIPEELIYLDDGKISPYGKHIIKSRVYEGVDYIKPPDEFLDKKDATWVFNLEFSLQDKDQSSGKNHRVLGAFLSGVTEKFCKYKVYDFMRLDEIPRLQKDQSDYYTKRMVQLPESDYTPNTSPPMLANPDLHGIYRGCFESFDGDVYVVFFFNHIIDPKEP